MSERKHTNNDYSPSEHRELERSMLNPRYTAKIFNTEEHKLSRDQKRLKENLTRGKEQIGKKKYFVF